MKTRVRAFLCLAGAVCGLALTLASSAHAEACPNETLRTELSSSSLPDCRAYEMVSPIYKEGYYVEPRLPLSSSGNRLVVYSLADLAGAPGSGEAANEASVYMDERGSAGWKLTSLNAPVSQFVGQELISVEPDDGETLWVQHTPAQGEDVRDLYVRSAGADGAFTRIGPLSLVPENEPPSDTIDTGEERFDRPIASTRDYGHVVLEASAVDDYWPFDHTGSIAGSIYEYSGTGNAQPILVGVEGEEKGSDDLISECGTELGSGGSGSEHNAISASGETIFVTVAAEGRFGCTAAKAPEYAELYARINGAVMSSGRAETVHVSASECTVACGAEESGNNFEGASESGELVYFTSTQKLTNDAVDGTASGNANKDGCAATTPEQGGCNLYLYDFAKPKGARLTTVAAGEVRGVSAISADGERIYFVSSTAIAGSGENEFSEGAIDKEPNLYVYDAESNTTTFVTTLGASEEHAWQKVYSHPFQVAGEHGRFLLFSSARPNLTPDDPTAKTQYFEYDAVTGELVRVSQGENGFDENGNGVAATVAPEALENVADILGNGLDFHSSGNSLSISDNGKTIVFRTRGQLSPRAISAARRCTSVYEFHTNGAIDEGAVHLVSDGSDTELYKGVTCGARLAGIDQSGANIFFDTADPLISSDTDGAQADIYDARVDGGFATPAAEESCVGEACGGPPLAPPVIPGAPVSTVLTGQHNFASPLPATPVKPAVKKPVKCPKGKKLIHHKCVKVKPKKKPKRR